MKAAGMALLLAAAACGGGGGKDAGNADGGGTDAGGPPVIVAFTSSDTSLPAGGGSITLSWSVTGATSLSIDQGVGDVTGMSSVSIDVTATTTYTLTATNALGSVQRSATVMVAPGMTVTGRIVGEDYVTPAANVTVGVLGRPVTTTDITGAFSIPGVSPPYSLVITTSAGAGVLYQAYIGLTRPDPTLVVDVVPAVDFNAAIYGSVTGGTGFPVPDAGVDAYGVSLSFDPVGAPQGGQWTANAATGDFAMGVIAPLGPSSLTGTVYALEWELPQGVGTPVAYAGFGSVPSITVVDGGSTDAGVIALAPVNAATLSFTATAPAGASWDFSIFNLFWPNGSSVLLGVKPGGATPSALVPDVPDASFRVSESAEADGGGSTRVFASGLLPGNPPAALSLPAPATLVAPAPGGTLNSPGTFSWQGSGQGVYLLVFGNTQRAWQIYTQASTFSLSDLDGVGPGIGAACTWEVCEMAPFASMDAFTSPGPPAYLVNGSITDSPSWSFTSGF